MIETLTLADLCQGGDPLVLSPDDPVSLALATMAARRLSSVVLASGDRPLGIFTERDALELIARGGYEPATPLRRLMSPDPITALLHETFVEGYTRMSGHGVRHLVLVDTQGRLYGVLSETDFAYGMGHEELLGLRTVADLMTRDPVTLPPHASVAAALNLMLERNISSVVITEGEHAVGILSERHAIPLAGTALDLQATPVVARMSSPVPTIAPGQPAYEASPRMRTLGVRHLVVESATGHLLGILSRRDLVKDLQDLYVRQLRRRVAEQNVALQAAHQQLNEQNVLRSLLDHSQHLGIIVADANLSIRFINAAALVALGLSDAEARSLPLPGLLTAAGLAAEGYARGLAGLVGAERIIHELSRPAGRHWRELRLVTSAIRDTTGASEGYLLTLQDRTQECADADRLRTLFENISEGILITDADNRIVAVNPAFTAITGYSAAEVVGRNPRLLASGRHDLAFYRNLWNRLLLTGAWSGEVWNRRKNGEIYPEWLQINLVRGPDGRVQQYLATITDQSAIHRSAAEIDYLSHFDPLTGLPNLARLREQLAEALERAGTGRDRLALLVLDLDHFQDLVATHGHLAGDEALELIGRRLVGSAQPADILARLAGDRFIITRPLVAKLDAAVQAVQTAQALQQLVHAPLNLTDLPGLRLTASLGVALYPEDGAGVNGLLRNAESALKQAKEVGRNSIALYRPEMTQAARRRIQLEGELRRALTEGELRLYYQPIIRVETREIVAAEALLRWQHPHQGLLTPLAFIDAVEKSDLVHPVGRWVFEQAAAQARDWLVHGRIRISINVNAHQIATGCLAQDLQDLLRRTDLDPDMIAIEVLESILLRDPDQALLELGRVRDLGVAIALDDFGSGYSSLSYLKRLPVDTIKIDQGFIRHLASNAVDQAIVRATIALAHDLGIRVVAEGVETVEQLNCLASIDCDLIQGYLCGRPQPPEGLTASLSNGST